MKGKLLPLLLLLFLGRPAASSCPDYWTQINSNCYKISPDRLNWYAAQEVNGTPLRQNYFELTKLSIFKYCGSEGGYLAEINDEDEQV